jgi:hypothetical protein
VKSIGWYTKVVRFVTINDHDEGVSIEFTDQNARNHGNRMFDLLKIQLEIPAFEKSTVTNVVASKKITSLSIKHIEMSYHDSDQDEQPTADRRAIPSITKLAALKQQQPCRQFVQPCDLFSCKQLENGAH